jgi:hypothetical protein
MDETPVNAVEAVVKDALLPQRQRGVIPDVRGVTELVRGIVERTEKRLEERRLKLRTRQSHRERDLHKPGIAQSEVDKRLRARGFEPVPGEWTVERGSDVRPTKKIITSTQVKTEWSKRFGKRLRRLRAEPDWQARVSGPVAVMMVSPDPEKRTRAMRTLLDIVDASSASFGDWRKDVRKRMFFDVGGV